jgi:hypothetical protein
MKPSLQRAPAPAYPGAHHSLRGTFLPKLASAGLGYFFEAVR